MALFLPILRKPNLFGKISIISLFLVLLPATKWSYSQNCKVAGTWLTPKKDCEVRLFVKGDILYGQFVWFADSLDTKGCPVKDVHNPEEALRSRPLLGKIFITGFEYNEKKNSWSKGRIYNPENGNTYKANLILKNMDTLEIRGYIGISFLGRTSIWTRKKKF